MVEQNPQYSAYAVIFERKMTEIFEELEHDEKKALKQINGEIDKRKSKISKAELL